MNEGAPVVDGVAPEADAPRDRVTLAEFLEFVARQSWKLSDRGAIVLVDDETRCPWLAWARGFGGEIPDIARIPPRLIFDAADGDPGHSEAIRALLLHACRLDGAR